MEFSLKFNTYDRFFKNFDFEIQEISNFKLKGHDNDGDPIFKEYFAGIEELK